MIFAVVFGSVMTQTLYRQKLNDDGAENFAKIRANVQKCQKYTSVSHPLNSPNDICCSFWVGYDPNFIQKKNK